MATTPGKAPTTAVQGRSGEGMRLLAGAAEVDFDKGLESLRSAGRRFTDLVRSIEDPNTKTRDLDWTLGELAAHVLQVFRYDVENARGTSEPFPIIDDDFISSGKAHNDRMIEAEPERDPKKLSALLDEVIEQFIDIAAERDPRQWTLLAGDNAMTLANLVGTLLGEVILHGYDIAQTTGKRLTIDPEAARQAVYATTATLPLAVNEETTRDLDVRLEMRIRGGERFTIHLDHGAARTEPATGRADLFMSSDPVAYLLVGFGRTSPWPQVLKGKMFSWGRRPSIAVKLPSFFRNP